MRHVRNPEAFAYRSFKTRFERRWAPRRITVFGTDFPSSDGTAVRDYVQVTDLADAHVRPTGYLEAGGENASFNLATALAIACGI